MSNHSGCRIFVLGSFVASCSVKTPRLPLPGESLRAEAFTLEAGGKGFNLAVGARRLGAAVDGLFAVGDDFAGRLAGPAFERAGLPPGMARVCAGAQTGGGVGFTDANGENCLAVYPGANLLLSAEDVRSAPALRQAGLTLAQFEIGDEPIAEAFAIARASGAVTVLNPSPARPLAPGLLRDTSILVLNRTEAVAIGDAPVPDGSQSEGDGVKPLARVAASLLARGPGLVIVTLGAGGALAFRPRAAPLHQPAFAVEAVDSLGAGDAFTAGFAVSLGEGRPLAECLRRAAACGALAVRRLGVFEALPDREELEAFLRLSDDA